jgi:transcription elongation factor Elf1
MRKTNKKKSMEEKEKKFCPKCKKEDISMNIPDAFSASQAAHPGWKCNNCGLKLPEFPFKNKINNKN